MKHLNICIFLGYVVKIMSEENVLNIVHVLIQLIQHTDWTTRHGGLLGLKYLLIVRKVSVMDIKFIFTILLYYIVSEFLFIISSGKI